MALIPLPIDEALPQIVDKLRSAGAVVLKAEPGAGKTTRVPPAILDAQLGSLEDGSPGQIIVLQPRRVAARSAAARISEERGTKLGEEIGYRVRMEGKSSRSTRVLVCTEGVFLRRLQSDPLLEKTTVVLFDEFHERSIDSDLALALVRQIRQEVRPDLRIVVMSATLEPGPIAAYLGNCPTVECPGRTFPIDIEYLQFAPNTQLPELVADGIKSMMPRTSGHLLAFLPGVGEIRRAQDILDAALPDDGPLVLPLFGEMSLEEQQQVLRPSRERKIILATNVAETSLTIDGVTAVVDSGMARINRFHPQLGLNRLELERISRASADQRAGRAGRNSPGQCLRLWTQRDNLSLRDFETPEILRVELSQCLLQLIAWGESDVMNFPWFEAPPASSTERALQLLESLGATSNGKITELGKRMASLPIQPRLARLLVEGELLGHKRRAALCAALLSERDPFQRPESRVPAEHRTDSDVLERVWALEEFRKSGARESRAGRLLAAPAKYILRAADELARVCDAAESKASCDQDQALLRALLAAFPDRVCKRRQTKEKRGVMVGGRGVRISDESGVTDCDLFLAVELSESGQAESLVRQASAIERAWLPESQINTAIEVVYDSERRKVSAMKRTRFQDLLIDETVAKIPADSDPGAVLAKAVASNLDVSALVDEEAKRYLARLESLREWMPELQLPDFGSEPWLELLPDWCSGCTSVAELTAESLIACMRARLSYHQLTAVDSEAPDRIELPSGRTAQLDYHPGKPPILAARIQEFFGTAETPRIAGRRISVLLHLLAPNYRVQQITPDLASFWKNTYPDVKKELKARYPKHAWPDNPLVVPPPRAQKGRDK